MRLPVLILSGIVLFAVACKKEYSCETGTITRECINYSFCPEIRYTENIDSVIVKAYDSSSGFTIVLKDTTLPVVDNEYPTINNFVDTRITDSYNYELILLPVNDTFRISGLAYEHRTEESWVTCHGSHPEPCANAVTNCNITRNGKPVIFDEEIYQFRMTTLVLSDK